MVWPDYTLGDVLNVFKQGKSHLGLVRDVNNSGEVCMCISCRASAMAVHVTHVTNDTILVAALGMRREQRVG